MIEECFAQVRRFLRGDGWFDLTFNATSGRERHLLHEDYYPLETLFTLAERYGFRASFQDDWEPRHKQSKLRLRQADVAGSGAWPTGGPAGGRGR